MSVVMKSPDAATNGFLTACVPFSKFCTEHLGVTARTGQRLVNEPDGLPVVKIGRRVLVHLPSADEWAKRRQTQRNPVRRGRAA